MAQSTSTQDKKNGLPADTWNAEPEIVTWEDEDQLPLHTGACDLYGAPISLGYDLEELRAAGIHIGHGPDECRRGAWRSDDHQGPFDESEWLAQAFEAGSAHPLKDVLPSGNPLFMIPGDLSPLATPFKEKVEGDKRPFC